MDRENFLPVVAKNIEKFEKSIEKISDQISEIDKVVSVNESKLEAQEKKLDLVFNKLKSNKDEFLHEVKSINYNDKKMIYDLDKRLSKLELWKYYVIGLATAIGFFIAESGIFKKIF